MDRKSNISLVRLVKLLFICASIYFWVLLPVIHAVVNYAAGSETAESVWISLMLFEPIDVLKLEPDEIPANWLSALFYYIEPTTEFLAFLATFFIALWLGRRARIPVRISLYLLSAVIILIVSSLIRDNVLGGILPLLAGLSGIAVAHIIIRSRHAETITGGSQPCASS